MDLPSRRYRQPDHFVRDFLATLTPGTIPRSAFINWDEIYEKTERLAPFVEFYEEAWKRVGNPSDFVREVADSLLSADQAYPLVKAAFEILGHTSREFVSNEDDVDIEQLSRRIESGDETAALYLANLLKALGLAKLIDRSDPAQVLLGVQIGLETHRRKNVGGSYFAQAVRSVLSEVCEKVAARLEIPTSLAVERRVTGPGGLSKRVDFLITVEGGPRVGVEANFYTVSGSKPTEIKRSYGQILPELRRAGVELIWITDGKGYMHMQRSLRDAYLIFPNIYNLRQARQHLADDLIVPLTRGAGNSRA